MSKIIAIVGGPGTGKTSVIKELQSRGYNTIKEAAREEIDEALAGGKTIEEIRSNPEEFQLAIVRRKIRNENEWLKRTDQEVVFVDRGMQDTWAYLTFENLSIARELEGIMNSHKYHKVFLLEELDNYDGEDYARTESPEEATKIHKLTEQAYKRYGMAIEVVPNMSVRERVDYILGKTF